MDKEGIYNFLKERGVWFVATEHEAIFSMEDLCDVELPYPESDAKNLFLRDKKKHNWYLVTVNGNKKVDLKKFREEQGTKALTFGSPDELMDKLGLVPGSVTPFGLLNDKENEVRFYIDEDFFHNHESACGKEASGGDDLKVECSGLIGIHPNDNTATVVLKTEDLINIIKENGTDVTVIRIPEKAENA